MEQFITQLQLLKTTKPNRLIIDYTKFEESDYIIDMNEEFDEMWKYVTELSMIYINMHQYMYSNYKTNIDDNHNAKSLFGTLLGHISLTHEKITDYTVTTEKRLEKLHDLINSEMNKYTVSTIRFIFKRIEYKYNNLLLSSVNILDNLLELINKDMKKDHYLLTTNTKSTNPYS
jgi:hypothetical protein